MFCKNCGSKLDEQAKFCSSCGTAVSVDGGAPRVKAQEAKLMLSTKPVFVPLVVLLTIVPLQLFFTVWAGLFFGGFAKMGMEFFKIVTPDWVPFVLCGSIVFFGFPFVFYLVKKITYMRTTYNFYSDRLEYSEGFWTSENKVIKYKNVTEINLRNGIMQKMFNLGTIILSTPATGGVRGRAISGIKLADLKNSEAIYNELLKILD
jgi:membrane protein YdbS with pleckstrin-like domain